MSIERAIETGNKKEIAAAALFNSKVASDPKLMRIFSAEPFLGRIASVETDSVTTTNRSFGYNRGE